MIAELLARVKSFFLPRKTLAMDPANRRQLVRVRCHIPVQCKPKDTTRSGWILDMGLQGMRVRFSSPLRVGSIVPMRATLPGQSRHAWVRCQVRWVRPLKEDRGYSHGVLYVETQEDLRRTWVSTLLRELGLDDRRLHERREFIRAEGKVPVVLEGQGAQPVETVNLGVGGLLVRSRQPLYAGTRFQVTLGPYAGLPPVGPLEAEVISSKADDVGVSRLSGLRFQELEPNQVRLLGRYVLSVLEAGSGR